MSLLHLIQRLALIQGITAGPGADQTAHRAHGSQFFRNVFAQGAYISSVRTNDTEPDARRNLQKLDFDDLDRPFFPFDLHALTGIFIQLSAVLFDGGHHRRQLH